MRRKASWQENEAAIKLRIPNDLKKKYFELLPFTLTNAQTKAIADLTADLRGKVPMNRLLEGDVGSGKTAVAAFAAYVCFANGYQTVFMAPTQILAQQHFATLKTLFTKAKISIGFLTSDTKTKDAASADIIVGTHALIHKNVSFRRVACVVIDEQHRFGVEQRKHLVQKSKNKEVAPHVLTMTATPIPRTIALTTYGDLDLSTLDELPPGRQQIKTWVVPEKKRTNSYAWIKKQIEEKNVQVFVVCPLIDQSEYDLLKQVKAVTVEFENVKNAFPDLNVGLLHGRMKSADKTKVLDKFATNKVNILVTTPVIEVGIDFPNATIVVIEAAERFGLAALHQLRGRVGRGSVASYCLLFTSQGAKSTNKRLTAMTQPLTGFELAEVDLAMRGPGELFGTLQHGFDELKVASWQDITLIKKTKLVASEIFKNPKANKATIDFYSKEVGNM
jgi:ATP-dependent DNA helicase RecG